MAATALNSVIALLGTNPFASVESPALRLAKFVRLEKNGKKAEIDAVIAAHTKHAGRIPPVTPPNALTFFATLAGRLVINQAGGILENTGLCLHRHFGDPFIPGSAVKGIARHAAWLEWNETAAPHEKERLQNLINLVFGPEDSTHAGAVAFLPALPAAKPQLVSDLTTCHHMNYYAARDKNAVALDNEEPNIQPFLAVDAGVAFRFTLVPLRNATSETLNHAKRWLIAAVTVSGAGAKTASGYGWFAYDEEAENARHARETAAAQAGAEAAKRADAEQAALAAMSPLDRAKAEFLKLNDQHLAEKIKTIATLADDEQRALVHIFTENKTKREKLKTWRKNANANAQLLADAASRLGEKLP